MLNHFESDRLGHAQDIERAAVAEIAIPVEARFVGSVREGGA